MKIVLLEEAQRRFEAEDTWCYRDVESGNVVDARELLTQLRAKNAC